MDLGTLIIFILLFFITIILIYRPVPILAFPMMIVFFWVGVTEFLPLADTVLPFNPTTTFIFLLFCALGILVNALSYFGD